MTDDQNLVVSDIQNNGIAFLTLNRPRAMNALNVELIHQFEKAFYEVEDDPTVKGIVIRGAGKFFVAGADIKFFIEKIQEKNFSDILAFTRKTSELFLAIEQSKKITVAVLAGLSLGGGSELALSCQSIIATEKGSMAFPETAIGIYPGLGGMVRLAENLGPALAKYYVFTGNTISASDAKELGIVTHLVPSEELEETVVNIALNEKSSKKESSYALPDRFNQIKNFFSHMNFKDLMEGRIPAREDADFAAAIIKILGKKAPIALEMANDIIDQQVGKSTEDAIEIELSRLQEIFSTKDALEGLSSAGKRKPTYSGK